MDVQIPPCVLQDFVPPLRPKPCLPQKPQLTNQLAGQGYRRPSLAFGRLVGSVPCLPNSYHYEIPEQGKGTNDPLLSLDHWLISKNVF